MGGARYPICLTFPAIWFRNNKSFLPFSHLFWFYVLLSIILPFSCNPRFHALSLRFFHSDKRLGIGGRVEETGSCVVYRWRRHCLDSCWGWNISISKKIMTLLSRPLEKWTRWWCSSPGKPSSSLFAALTSDLHSMTFSPRLGYIINWWWTLHLNCWILQKISYHHLVISLFRDNSP